MTSAVSDRTAITMLVWLKPEGQHALARFREQAAPLWQRYDVRVERVLTGAGKGQLVGTNDYEVPEIMQVISVPSMASFQQYVADPEYQRLAAERDAGIARMVAVIGAPLDVSAFHPESSSETSARLYGLAFVRFLAGGAEGMLEFNRRAKGLFERHGMHIESMIDVAKTVTPVGSPLASFAPERVLVFFLDDPSAMKGYAADPEYKDLAPMRDRGLDRYDFFVGKVPQAPGTTARDPSAPGAGN